jgi:hypothetical protein
MNETKAKKILEEAMGPNCCGDALLALRKKPYSEFRPWVFAWAPGDLYAGLNGMFTAVELEAIAWWMKNKGKKT